MREKLIELSKQLRYCANVSDCETCKRLDKVCEQKCVDNLLLEAAELLESVANGVVVSKMETTTKWIPVTERLPEKHEHILALTPNKMHGGYTKWLIWYDPKSGFYDSDPEWGDIEMDDVTHWMPLPEAPKGE